ncbi:MAG: transcription antitermination factor NusB [Waddliaceae bacterium]
MAIPQQKFREIVFQFIYCRDIGEGSEEELISLFMKELSVTKKAVQEAGSRARKILAMLSEIDEHIKKTSVSYRFERIQSVERNILRLGVYELLFDDAIPPKVAIAEAIRLSRKFGTPESASFVNALLDVIYKSSSGDEINENHLLASAEALMDSEEIANKTSQNPRDQPDASNGPKQ